MCNFDGVGQSRKEEKIFFSSILWLTFMKALKTVFVRKTPKNEEIRTFAQFAIALGKPMKKE